VQCGPSPPKQTESKIVTARNAHQCSWKLGGTPVEDPYVVIGQIECPLQLRGLQNFQTVGTLSRMLRHRRLKDVDNHERRSWQVSVISARLLARRLVPGRPMTTLPQAELRLRSQADDKGTCNASGNLIPAVSCRSAAAAQPLYSPRHLRDALTMYICLPKRTAASAALPPMLGHIFVPV
jgi:hypothetical protein